MKPTVVEATSKKLKAHLALGVVVCLIGLPVLFYGGLNESDGMTMFGLITSGIGLAAIIIAKIRIWWNHG